MRKRNSPLGRDFAFGPNGLRYSQERAQRWDMEKTDGPAVVLALRHQISAVLGLTPSDITAEAYAETFAQIHPPQTPAELGRPDLRLSFNFNQQRLYLFCEIKIKTKTFQKTSTGGITARGSTIPRYGCPSFYLDADPVLKSIQAFCQTFCLEPKKFIFAFADPTSKPGHLPKIRLCSLAAIENLLQHGFRGQPIKTDFAEGYGAPCILIPIEATRRITDLTPEILCKACSMQPLAKPNIRFHPYAISQSVDAER